MIKPDALNDPLRLHDFLSPLLIEKFRSLANYPPEAPTGLPIYILLKTSKISTFHLFGGAVQSSIRQSIRPSNQILDPSQETRTHYTRALQLSTLSAAGSLRVVFIQKSLACAHY